MTAERIFRCPIPLGEYERNIGEMLAERAQRFGAAPLLLERPSGAEQFVPYSWRELYAQIGSVGEALAARGVESGDRVAILSPNRREMFVAVMALYSMGAVSVPIFFGYFPEQVEFILNHSGAKFLIAADPLQVDKVAKSAAPLPNLQGIFVMDHFERARLTAEQSSHIDIRPFSDLLKMEAGDVFRERVRATGTDDTCVIMYTSGTTGRPKGVELTHRNLLSQQKAFSHVWDLSPKDRFLSYLPWHHCFGGNFETFMAVYFGIPMALDASRGKDLDLLLQNYRMIRPTIYFSVPAVFQMLIREMTQNPALEKEIFHPELRAVFTAAAPLPPDLYQVFIDRGVPVHEGWGLTEASPDITLTRFGKTHQPGIVGEPIPGVELKILDDGEICARGPNIMKGYYRDEDATRRVLDDQGWLHTGDLGEVGEHGLRIVGRADGVFKLVNGEKVPSAHLEGALISKCPYIERVVVVGSGREYVVAVFFPHEKLLCHWAKEKSIAFKSLEDLLQRDEVKALFTEGVRQANQDFDAKYYRIRRFYLSPHAATLERGEITPTAKTCRQRVIQNYSDAIAEMFRGVLEGARYPFVTV